MHIPRGGGRYFVKNGAGKDEIRQIFAKFSGGKFSPAKSRSLRPFFRYLVDNCFSHRHPFCVLQKNRRHDFLLFCRESPILLWGRTASPVNENAGTGRQNGRIVPESNTRFKKIARRADPQRLPDGKNRADKRRGKSRKKATKNF